MVMTRSGGRARSVRRPPAALGIIELVRSIGVEEELLVVDPAGHPVPLGPEALEVAARRGEGETAEEHDREDGAADEESAAHLMPELKASRWSWARGSARRWPRSRGSSGSGA